MADPLASVSTGQPIAIRAEAWNAIVASARAHQQGRRVQPGKGAPLPGAVVVDVLNDSGADIREYKPLAVTGAGGYDLGNDTAAQDWERRPLFTGGVPAAATDFVVITLDAIPDGGIGRAVISGPALCDIDSASGAAWAKPQAGDSSALLGTATAGTVRVLSVPASGGSQRRCAVYVGDQVAGGSAGSPVYAEDVYPYTTYLTTTPLHILSVEIPSDGAYLIGYQVLAQVVITDAAGSSASVAADLISSEPAAGTGVPATRTLAAYGDRDGIFASGVGHTLPRECVAGEVLTLRVWKAITLSATVATATVNGGYENTRLWAAKLADASGPAFSPVSPPPPPASPPPPAIPPPPPSPPPGGSSIRGTCTSGSPDFDPWVGRSVVLSGDNTATTTTDVYGRYEFGSLTAGTGTFVTFDADDPFTCFYSTDGAGYFGSGETANPALAADSLHTVDYIAAAGTDGVIAGTVADGVGSPLSGRLVVLSGTAGNTGTATTDGSGGYSFSGLTYGDTTATCSPSGGHVMGYSLDSAGYTGTTGVATFDVTGTHDLDFKEELSSPPVPPPPPGP